MQKISQIFESFSVSFIGGIFCIFILSSFGFLFGLSINQYYSFVGLLCALIVLYKKLKIYKTPNFLIFLLLVFQVLLVVCITNLATTFTDVSWDGRTYHQTAIIFLNSGWNPVWQNAIDFAENNYSFDFIRQSLIWIQHYVKFSEIFAANIFSVTNHVESGKIVNYLSILSLFLYSFYTLSKPLFNKISVFNKFLFSFLIVFNPVVIQQMSTYYIDGLLYCYFILILFGFLNIQSEDKHKYSDGFVIGSSVVILANIKFGGLFYAVLLIILFFIYLKYTKNHEEIKIYKHFVFYVVALIIFTGVNPYITNLKERHHFFYPLVGAEKKDVISYNMPKQFRKKPMPYKFFYSTFSETLNTSFKANRKITLKVPFTVHLTEFVHLGDADTRIGGFGIFWSGILVLSLIMCLCIKLENENEKRAAIILFTFLLMSVLLNPENWWARYVPQFWAFPLFVLLFVQMSKVNKNLTAVSYFILVCIFLNSFVTFRINTNYNHKKREKMQNMLLEHNKDISLYHPTGTVFEFSLLQKFNEYNYKYKFVKKKEYDKDKDSYELIPFTVTEKVYWRK